MSPRLLSRRKSLSYGKQELADAHRRSLRGGHNRRRGRTGMSRKVEHVIKAHRQLEGGGFVVRRPFPTGALELVDPFLLLDEMGPAEYGPGEAVGAPDHPHRGFETVTYMLDGQFEHEDSAGNKGAIAAGDVQWM